MFSREKKLTTEIETTHYDGSYCPECQGKNVEIIDNEHDFGFLQLNIKCQDCKCEYTSFIQVSNNKLVNNRVDVVSGNKNSDGTPGGKN